MSRSRAWSATRDPAPGPRATRPARRTESRAAAWRFGSFQRDEIRGEVMDIGIPPLREHVDMPLQWIGDDDLGDRIVSGEALVRTVRLSQRDDEGGDVIEISRNGLPRGQRHRYRRRRPFRRCRPGRPATKAPAAATGHDQVLNRLGIVLRADGGEVSARRVTLRAVSRAVEIGFPFLGATYQDIKRGGVAGVGRAGTCAGACRALMAAAQAMITLPRNRNRPRECIMAIALNVIQPTSTSSDGRVAGSRVSARVAWQR